MKFVPTVESQLFKGPKFLIDTPHELIKSGKIANKVPLMTGFTQNEGGFYTAMRKKDS
jgi:carboxylesterase type B